MTNTATMPKFNSFIDVATLDKNRPRTVVFYGRVSTEHEAQLSALENQMQWYNDEADRHKNWTVVDTYIDEGITGTQAKKRPAFLKMIEDAKQGKFDLIVTREVCRFARNVIDALEFTRMLRGIGVEVYFTNDNIWTFDGNDELKLGLMATFAQEESRKVSERVKAGQRISRENKTLYGNGNILGYDLDKEHNNYVINPEEAETVRMIFDMYEQGKGGSKIATELMKLGRKTARGSLKWTASNITRIIANATYKGYICYNKSRSNNFLEQKRVVNRNKDTFVLVKGDFEPIISEGQWEACNKIISHRKKIIGYDGMGGRIEAGYRPSSDIWARKLKCPCGSNFRKNIYHKNKDGEMTYLYICYNQINNGSVAKRTAAGLDTEGCCDNKAVLQWRMDMMGDFIIKEIWETRSEDLETALELIKQNYVKIEKVTPKSDKDAIREKLDKVEGKLNNLIMMRTEGEISKEEFQRMREGFDKEIAQLTARLNADDEVKVENSSFEEEIKRVQNALAELNEVGTNKMKTEWLNRMVASVVPNRNRVYEWHINSRDGEQVIALCAGGDRRSKTNRPYVYLYGEEADDSASDIHIFSYDCLVAQLHRLLSDKDRRTPFHTFSIGFDEAKAFRKATGSYLRENQWNDLTVDV